MADFLIEDNAALEQLQSPKRLSLDGDAPEPELTSPIAVRLRELTVHNNKKWFGFLGGADIRVDMLAVQGNYLEDDDPSSFFSAATLRYSDIGDKASLPIDDQGLIAFFGWPKHFLDISISVSRDTKDSEDLADLLKKELVGDDFKDAAGKIAQLVVTGGTSLAITGAIGAAATLASLSTKILHKINGSTIGVYRGNRLAQPGQFGLGRNPDEGTYDVQDMSLWFDVIEAKAND